MSKADMNDDDGGDLRRAYATMQRDQPPAALDAAIIAQARGAVERQSAPRKGSAVRGAPVAVAAMLVVTASLVMMMDHEQAQIAVLAPPASDAELAPAFKEPAQAVQPADAAPPKLAQALPAAPARDQAPGQGGPQAAAQVKPQSGLSRSPADAASSPLADRQAFPAARMAESASSPPPGAAPGAAARMESGMPQDSVATPAAASRAAGQAPAGLRRLQAREDAAPKVVASDAAKKDESPAAWLARIAELRKLGRVKEAEESFAEFRKRYPDYPIPAEPSSRTTIAPD